MGDWAITIRGTGPHHNGKPTDAEVVAGEAVDRLLDAGHTLHEAAFTSGSKLEFATRKLPPKQTS
jgi:hypothetical protein